MKEIVYDPKFQWHDYILFSLMLILSTLIGLYFGYKGRKNGTVDDYILAGKTMKAIPIAFSTTSTIITALSIVSTPAEIYKFGAAISSIVLTIPILVIGSYYAVFPIYYKTKITTTFEYLEIRFNTQLKKIAAACYMLISILLCPIYMYLPSLLLAQGSNINVNYINVAVTVICVFYTTLGGIRAVVWTDALQYIFMLATFITVCVVGTKAIGSFTDVFQIAIDGNRFDIDFDFDLTKRETIWAGVLGHSITWLPLIITHQTTVQKFLSLENLVELKKSLVWFTICISGTFFLITYLGLLMYAEFQNCDPLLSKRINKHDQMVPYYILHMTRSIPGLAGLFIAGIFSASLSSLSSALNAISSTIYNDFLRDILPKNTSQRSKRLLLNLVVTVLGCISLSLSFVIPILGPLFGVSVNIVSIAFGPILGLFALGMFVPKAHSKGAILGTLISLLFLLWIVSGTQYYQIKNRLVPETKKISIEGCSEYLNVTNNFNVTNSMDDNFEEKPMFLYRISFFCYIPIGVTVVLLMGIVFSKLLKSDDPKVKKDLISPIMHWALESKKKYTKVEMQDISTPGII